MQYIMSEGEALYMDAYKGQFSKKMAEWAISKMQVKDEGSGRMRPLQVHPLQEMEEQLRMNGVALDEECVYTAWYLWNMTFADYRRSLDDMRRKALWVGETLYDPDGSCESVLACFRAKMDVAGVPIHWERMM